jgi:hypothetical protein
MINTLAQSCARVLALVIIQTDPGAVIKPFFFNGASLEISGDEEIVITYERRRRKKSPLLEMYVSQTPIPSYDVERA